MNNTGDAAQYHLASAYISQKKLQRMVIDNIAQLDAHYKPTVTLPLSPKMGTPQMNPADPKTIGVYTGAFHPLTFAHLAVAEAALQTGLVEQLLLSMSRTTLHKVQLPAQEQALHLLMLAATAQRDVRMRVALFNCGLYKEQARAVRAAFPQVEDVFFIIGFDKALQILDPAYYADRDTELQELFGLAQFLVCPRMGYGKADLAELFSRPENIAWKARAHYIDLSEKYADISSTMVRTLAEQHKDVSEFVPPEQLAMWKYQLRLA